MGDDSHFVLQFCSVFSVGMYICSVLQVLTWRGEHQCLIAENNAQKMEINNLKVELEAV